MALPLKLGLIVKASPTPGFWYMRKTGQLRYKQKPNTTPTHKTTQTGEDEDIERIIIPTGHFTEGTGMAAQGFTTQIDTDKKPRSVRHKKRANRTVKPGQWREQHEEQHEEQRLRQKDEKNEQDEGIADCRQGPTIKEQITMNLRRIFLLKTPKIHINRLQPQKPMKRGTKRTEDNTRKHKKPRTEYIERTPQGTRNLDKLYKQMIEEETTPEQAAQYKMDDTWGPSTSQQHTDNTTRKPTRPRKPPTTKKGRKQYKSREFLSSDSEDNEKGKGQE